MLDFLNLKEEGEMLIIFATLAGILGGIAYGLLMTAGKEKKDLPRKIFGWLFAALAVPACGLVLVSGFIQLIRGHRRRPGHRAVLSFLQFPLQNA